MDRFDYSCFIVVIARDTKLNSESSAPPTFQTPFLQLSQSLHSHTRDSSGTDKQQILHPNRPALPSSSFAVLAGRSPFYRFTSTNPNALHIQDLSSPTSSSFVTTFSVESAESSEYDGRNWPSVLGHMEYCFYRGRRLRVSRV